MTDPTAGTEAILVVDDNGENRRLAEGLLGAFGYTVILAESGFQALALFEERPQDLVLLDVVMPRMDGFETCRRLRELPGGADTPIVFLTALGEVETHQRAMDSGGDDFLGKPINRTELLLRVRSLLRIRRIGRELRGSHELIASQRDALLRAKRQSEELTALVVHDLKNPLAAILANVQYALRTPGLSEEVQEALQDSVSASQSMHTMVLNLLDISRSEDGALVPKRADVDLVSLLEQVCAGMRQRAAQNAQVLSVTSAVEKLALRVDPELVRRMVENLLDNSLKYTPRGGTIRVELKPGDGRALLRICDEGPGVPTAHREQVFEKYVQLDRGGGAQARLSRGLGLAFCRMAVDVHGGRIWIEDNEPTGSAFCVDLPIGVEP